MGDTIKIRMRNEAKAEAVLAAGELGYHPGENRLYIGTTDGNKKIGADFDGTGRGEATVLGYYPVHDPNACFVVGNGDADNPANAMVIKKTGNAIFAGTITATSFVDADGNEYVLKNYVDKKIEALRTEFGLLKEEEATDGQSN